MSKHVHILNLQNGNSSSVQHALQNIGVSSSVCTSLHEMSNAERIIIPGIGHFDRAMKTSNEARLADFLFNHIERELPILGICLGMQILAEESEEGNQKGLGIFNAKVKELKVDDSIRFKVPHNGWNTLVQLKSCELLKNINEDDQFFFLHKYHWLSNTNEEVFAETCYNQLFPTVIGKDNCWGVQFHPEKSHEAGLKLLSNFMSL